MITIGQIAHVAEAAGATVGILLMVLLAMVGGGRKAGIAAADRARARARKSRA